MEKTEVTECCYSCKYRRFSLGRRRDSLGWSCSNKESAFYRKYVYGSDYCPMYELREGDNLFNGNSSED